MSKWRGMRGGQLPVWKWVCGGILPIPGMWVPSIRRQQSPEYHTVGLFKNLTLSHLMIYVAHTLLRLEWQQVQVSYVQNGKEHNTYNHNINHPFHKILYLPLFHNGVFILYKDVIYQFKKKLDYKRRFFNFNEERHGEPPLAKKEKFYFCFTVGHE